MARKFHYNKTTIQDFRKQLAIREKALPILKNKETMLRNEVRRRSGELEVMQKEQEKLSNQLEDFKSFWVEFPQLISMKDPGIFEDKVAGVRVPEIDEIVFEHAEVSWVHYPAWIPMGIKWLEAFISNEIKIDIKSRQIALLDRARKKTTQKVNLYEKVQIPAYEEGIREIKRFLEDIENISKAGLKIMKKRQEETEMT